MRLLRFLLPALFAMIAVAPAATVDVQVERPAPDEPGSTQHDTVSIAFRAVDYRPALHAELEIEVSDEDEPDPTPVPASEPEPRTAPRRAPLAPPAPALPIRSSAPSRSDVAAGRIVLPPPANRV